MTNHTQWAYAPRRVSNKSHLYWGACIDGLAQNRRNSSALTMELCLSYINPAIWGLWFQKLISQRGISNCIPQYSVECKYLSMPVIPASGANALMCAIEPGIFGAMLLCKNWWNTTAYTWHSLNQPTYSHCSSCNAHTAFINAKFPNSARRFISSVWFVR